MNTGNACRDIYCLLFKWGGFEMRMRRKILIGFCGGALTWLAGCGGSGHTSTEKYWLVATNIKIPYWQSVNAGLMHAAQQIGVKAEMVGRASFDPKGGTEAFHRGRAGKPRVGDRTRSIPRRSTKPSSGCWPRRSSRPASWFQPRIRR